MTTHHRSHTHHTPGRLLSHARKYWAACCAAALLASAAGCNGSVFQNLPGKDESTLLLYLAARGGAGTEIQSISSSSANGLYGIGDSVNITVTFTKPVTLAGGTLEITLDTGEVISISAASYPSTVFTGTYVVASGQESPDLNATAINLVGGTLTDSKGNEVFLLLPSRTLAQNKNLVVDGIAPTNQDAVFPTDATERGTDTVTIASSGDPTNQVWFAPAGTTVFTPGSTMTMASNGTATVIDAPDDEGTYYIYIIDAAGNVSVQSTAALTVDNTPPDVAITAPNGGGNFSTGTAIQTIRGSCSTDTDLITASSGTFDDDDCSDGEWSLDPLTLSEGSNTITVTATDAAGNPAQDAITITLDTSLLSIDIAYDLDVDPGTNDTSPFRAGVLTITATFAAAPAGTPQIAIDQAGSNDVAATDMSGSGVTWTYTYTINPAGGGNADGPASITLSNIVPSGGGIYATPSNATFTIDTTVVAPSVPDLAAADDEGSSNSDNITNQTSGLTFSGTSEANATIEIYNGASKIGETTANGAGNWTIELGLSAGTYSINAVQTDAAGNISSASGNLNLTIDISASAPSTPDLAAGNDTGAQDDDNITNDTDNLSFSGTAEPNASVQLYDGTTPLGSPATADGSGNWTATIASMIAGAYHVNAIQTDRAGNTSTASGNLDLTIDTSIPSAPGTPDLAAGNDTGPYDDDNITSDTSDLAFSGTAEPGATVQLYDGTTPLGSPVTADGSGNWTITIATLAAGTYTINAKQTDTAGNESATASANMLLVIDTSAAAPAAPDLAAANDTGYLNTDDITNDTTDLLFSGTAEPNASVQLYNDASPLGTAVTADGSGNWTKTYAILTAGSYSINAIQTDRAGNESAASGNLALVIDTTPPEITATAPAGGASVNNTRVSYTLSEDCAEGSITWTHVSGPADIGSPHEQALAGTELDGIAHTTITLTNNPTLVNDVTYDITFYAEDAAGNTDSVTASGVAYSGSPLAPVSADTIDIDNDGKIDAYRVTFSKDVDDSTFPGYSPDIEGTATDEWLVAGYANVRLLHGDAVAAAGIGTDTENDEVIYLRFDETLTACSASDQSGCDTHAKPDLTTTATPGLLDLFSTTLTQIESSALTEADSAQPVLLTARSLNMTAVDVIFSEDMEQSTSETTTNYGITSGITVNNAALDTVNNKIVHLTTGTQTGGTTYTLTVSTAVRDAANNSLDPTDTSVDFVGNVRPIVVSIETVNATTLTITFNETVIAGTGTGTAECGNLTECAAIYTNASLPVKSAVSTGGAGVNSATFTLTVNPMAEGQLYTTAVLENTVTSSTSGFKMGPDNNSATFSGDGRPGAYISTDTATECPTPLSPPSTPAQTRVIVQYDQTVTATAQTEANYKITLCLFGLCTTGTGGGNQTAATDVTDMGGNKYAVDFPEAFYNTDGSIYQLTITGVQDASGNTVNAPTNLGFQCGTDNTPPTLIRADVVAANTSLTVVMLTFSESVLQATANDANNYKYDSEAYGFEVSTAARQSNYAQVLVTFVPGLSIGGHQIRVQNVQDLAGTPNTIADNGITNVQPILVTAPESLDEGTVFEDPFNDGTKAALIVRYDGKIYLGTDSGAAKLFEMDYGLTTSQVILIDADGTPGYPVQDFNGYTTLYSNSGTQNPDTTLKGVDTLYAACVGGTSTPDMTGAECAAAGGTESLFIGALNISGMYKSFWHTTDVSSLTTTFTFDEEENPDTGGSFAFRSTVFLVFKDQLWNHFGAEAGGGGRGGRICMKASGCDDGTPYLNTLTGGFPGISSVPRIGVSGSPIKNGSQTTIVQSMGGDTTHTNYLNAINALYEHDNDGSGSNNESQIYMANGGVFLGTLGQARAAGSNSDGGIVRSQNAYSSRTSLPVDCSNTVGSATYCPNYWEDITPEGNTDWNNFVSIPYPENSAITGAACSGSAIEMDCTEPFNLFTPSMKAVPYMRTAPNGDLYMIRNACSSQTVCYNGSATCDFRTSRQVCPALSEVTQLWMLPKYTGACTLTTSLTGTGATTDGSMTLTGTGTSFLTQLFSGATITVNGQTRKVAYITSDTSLSIYGSYLTGTASITSGSNVLTGTGTLFTTELAVGQSITVNGQTRTIATITSDTSLTVTPLTLTGTGRTYNASTRLDGSNFNSQLAVGDSITVNSQTKTVASIASNTRLEANTNWSSNGSGFTIYLNSWRGSGSGYPIVEGFSGAGSGYTITLHDNPYATQTACTGAGGSWASGSTGSSGAAKWQLVAEYLTTRTTTMEGNDSVGATNTHISLLEFVGDWIYIGYDNPTDRANIWRADMSAVASGSFPAEGNFEIVNVPGLDGSADNEKIFSHITVNESGTDWLILTTRDGTGAVRIYRTANGQD